MTKPFILAVGAMLLTSPAMAGGIVCHDEYQVVNGQEISTPYCADEYLAKVARKRGWKVTGDQIRHDYSLKESVCLHIGGHAELELVCTPFRDYGNGD